MLMEGLKDRLREATGALAGLTPVEDSLDSAEPEEDLLGSDLLLWSPPPQLPNAESHLCPPTIRRRRSSSCYRPTTRLDLQKSNL
jgi:hypothetical protein